MKWKNKIQQKFKRWILSIFYCQFFHNWEISQICDKKGRYKEFHRTCKKCGFTQYLGKPKKYHPSAYVWRNYMDR